MKKPFLAVLLFLSVIMWSCSPIIKMLYGIHQPRIMNKQKILTYLSQNRLDTANNLVVSCKSYLYVINHIQQNYPEMICFDNAGDFIPYKEDTQCNASAFRFIDSLSVNRKYSVSDTLKLVELQNNFCGLDGDSGIKIIGNENDYYVLIFWAEWTGNLNKDHTLVWEKKALRNKNAKIKVIKINCDFQEFWDRNEREKIINQLSKK